MLQKSSGRLLALGAAMAIMVACSPTSDQASPTSDQASPTSDQASAEQELCDSLAAFRDSVEAIGDFDPATDSLEDLDAARQAAGVAGAQVEENAANVVDANSEAVDAAFVALVESLHDLPADMPLADVKVLVDDAVGEVQDAIAEMRDGLGCE